MSSLQPLIPGPAHPDLFDGETPMTYRLDDLIPYRLEIVPAGMGHISCAVMVLAATCAREAHQLALADYAQATGLSVENLDLVGIELLHRPATTQEKRAYLDRQESAS